MLCDYSKHTIDIWVKILKATSASFTIHAEKLVEIPYEDSLCTVRLPWDYKKRKLTHEYTASVDAAADLSLVYPKGIQVVNTNNTVMLLDDGKPKLTMYPDEWLNLNSNFVTSYQGKDYEFVFDSLTNQY